MRNIRKNFISFKHYLQFDHKKLSSELFVHISFRIEMNDTGSNFTFLPYTREFLTSFKISVNKVNTIIQYCTLPD